MMKVLSIFGTRPEAIKMAPLVKLLSRESSIQSKICLTGQHREMLDQVMDLFDINGDYDLNVMSPNQSLTDITSSILRDLTPVLNDFKPSLVLVHGDTTTTIAASLASYYMKIPIGHVEAGLRTGNIYSPWPEEANRRLTSGITKYHFAPTPASKKNLEAEGINKDDILVTGNTVIDALFFVINKLKADRNLNLSMKRKFNFLDEEKKTILITGHRRENFGEGFKNICQALRIISENKEVQIVYPVHLNPNVQEPVHNYLGGLDNVHLIEPLSYLPFCYLMTQSYLLLTDSGGIQEEAPSLGKPVLVMRDSSERPEAIDNGTVRLVGTNVDSIVSNVKNLIKDKKDYNKMSFAHNPYGDGRASQRILDFILQMGDS